MYLMVCWYVRQCLVCWYVIYLVLEFQSTNTPPPPFTNFISHRYYWLTYSHWHILLLHIVDLMCCRIPVHMMMISQDLQWSHRLKWAAFFCSTPFSITVADGRELASFWILVICGLTRNLTTNMWHWLGPQSLHS